MMQIVLVWPSKFMLFQIIQNEMTLMWHDPVIVGKSETTNMSLSLALRPVFQWGHIVKIIWKRLGVKTS